MSKLLRQHGTEHVRPASAFHPVELSERIKRSLVCDIGQSPRAALFSRIMQEDQADACLSVTSSTNDRSIYVCYGTMFVSPRRI
jgi:hypothetical protein